jgi:hypothetical protein
MNEPDFYTEAVWLRWNGTTENIEAALKQMYYLGKSHGITFGWVEAQEQQPQEELIKPPFTTTIPNPDFTPTCGMMDKILYEKRQKEAEKAYRTQNIGTNTTGTTD